MIFNATSHLEKLRYFGFTSEELSKHLQGSDFFLMYENITTSRRSMTKNSFDCTPLYKTSGILEAYSSTEAAFRVDLPISGFFESLFTFYRMWLWLTLPAEHCLLSCIVTVGSNGVRTM